MIELMMAFLWLFNIGIQLLKGRHRHEYRIQSPRLWMGDYSRQRT